MTKEEFNNLPDEEKKMLHLGAGCLTKIMNQMVKCELGDDESTMIFTCRDDDGDEYFFNVTGYKINSPKKPDI